MTLTVEVREVILNMEKEAVTAKAGVKNLLDELDKMYLKDGKFSGK